MIPVDTSGPRKQHLSTNLSTESSDNFNNNSNNNNNNNTSNTSDDVHSLCSQLSQLPAGPTLSIQSGNSLSSGTLAALPKPINHPYLKKCFAEIALLPTRQAQFQICSFEKTQIVQEFLVLGENLTFKKQASRGTNNPWRRHGALTKLHEIGGYAPSTNDKKERKNRDQLIHIKKNSKPPIAPKTSQMTLNRVKENNRQIVNHLQMTVPKNMNVVEAAQKMAEQIAAHVLTNGHCLVKEEDFQN